MFVMLCNGLWDKVIPTRLNFSKKTVITAGHRDKRFLQDYALKPLTVADSAIFYTESCLWTPGGTKNFLALALGTFLHSEPTNPLTCFAATGSSTGHALVTPWPDTESALAAPLIHV